MARYRYILPTFDSRTPAQPALHIETCKAEALRLIVEQLEQLTTTVRFAMSGLDEILSRPSEAVANPDLDKAKRALVKLQRRPGDLPRFWNAEECQLLNELIDAMFPGKEGNRDYWKIVRELGFSEEA